MYEDIIFEGVKNNDSVGDIISDNPKLCIACITVFAVGLGCFIGRNKIRKKLKTWILKD